MDFFSSEIIFIVAVYLRLSKEDGDLDTAGKSESNSIQNQKALILDFLKKPVSYTHLTLPTNSRV